MIPEVPLEIRPIPGPLRRLLRRTSAALKRSPEDYDMASDFQDIDGVVWIDGSDVHIEYFPPGGIESWQAWPERAALPELYRQPTLEVHAGELAAVPESGLVRPLDRGEVEREVDSRLQSTLREVLRHGRRFRFRYLRPERFVRHAELGSVDDSSTHIFYAHQDGTLWTTRLHAEELEAAAAGTHTIPVAISEMPSWRRARIDRPHPHQWWRLAVQAALIRLL